MIQCYMIRCVYIYAFVIKQKATYNYVQGSLWVKEQLKGSKRAVKKNGKRVVKYNLNAKCKACPVSKEEAWTNVGIERRIVAFNHECPDCVINTQARKQIAMHKIDLKPRLSVRLVARHKLATKATKRAKK